MKEYGCRLCSLPSSAPQAGPKAEAGRKKDQVQNPKPRRVRQHGHVDYHEGEQNQTDCDAVYWMPFRSEACRQPRARKRPEGPTQRGQQQNSRRISCNMGAARRKISRIRTRGKRMENGTHILHTDSKDRRDNEAGDDGARTSKNRTHCSTSIPRLPHLTIGAAGSARSAKCRSPEEPPEPMEVTSAFYFAWLIQVP